MLNSRPRGHCVLRLRKTVEKVKTSSYKSFIRLDWLWGTVGSSHFQRNGAFRSLEEAVLSVYSPESQSLNLRQTGSLFYT